MAVMTTVDILQRLIAFPTVSSASNLPLIKWVAGFLREHGVDSHTVSNDAGTKANLYATIGAPVGGGLVFSGHTDVVPVDGQAWTREPFGGEIADGCLYGRGACDMKGFIASVLSAVPAMARAKLARPVHLAFSYDEEVGCLGAPAMIAAMLRSIERPAAVIVGEPTGMRLANAHKGVCVHRTVVQGSEAHSSLTHSSVSAVMLAGQLISRLVSLSQRAEQRRRMAACLPPHTSISANMVQGGTALNILAKSCEIVWDIRWLPGDAPQFYQQDFDQYAQTLVESTMRSGRTCSIATQTLIDVPALDPADDGAEQLIASVLDAREDPLFVPFCTEAGQFQAAGWPAIVCGPGFIDQAHKPDEFISLEQLHLCDKFIARAVAAHCC